MVELHQDCEATQQGHQHQHTQHRFTLPSHPHPSSALAMYHSYQCSIQNNVLGAQPSTAFSSKNVQEPILLCLGAHAQARYRIAGIFRGYKFSRMRMDHYKGFRRFYFRGLSSSLLAHAHITCSCTTPLLASNP